MLLLPTSICELEHIFYINLLSRPDRDAHIKEELLKLNITTTNAKRFCAIHATSGAVGCSLSHIGVLQSALHQRLPYVVVLEDDICFLDPDCIQQSYTQFASSQSSDEDWDVLLIGGNVISHQPIIDCPFYSKVTKCQTTVGYIVRGNYIPTLLQNFKQGCKQLIAYPHLHKAFAIDQFWFPLQKRDKWFILTPLTVSQMPGYSDIEHRRVNYDKAMTTLNK